MTSYGTPGLLLSQPARRPRSYRPRTISYSFEESERASATYEQFQGSDSDSTGGRLPDEPRRSLHGELEAGSSQSASLESNMPSSPPDFSEASLSRIAQATPGAERIQRAQSPSPQLPLPPPFSAVRRNISVAASLPSAPGEVSQSRSPTPVYDLPQLQASPVAASTTSSHEEDDAVYGVSYAQCPVTKRLMCDSLAVFSVIWRLYHFDYSRYTALVHRSKHCTTVQARDTIHHWHCNLRVRALRKLQPALATSFRSTMTACQLSRSPRRHCTYRKRGIKAVFTPRTPRRPVEEWTVHEQADRRLLDVVEHGAIVPQEWRRQASKGFMAGRKMLMTMSCLIAPHSDCGPCRRLGDTVGP